jgi:hypothetical protein
LCAQAEVEVQVEPSQIASGENFQLTLSQENVTTKGVPNLTVLQKDFTIVGTARSVNYSVINGQAQSSTQWVITLQPKKSGILTIPAIKVGDDQTNPVTINVTQGATLPNNQTSTDQTKSSAVDDVQLVVSVDEKKPYINQQITYKVTLYNRKRLLDASYQPPKVEDALLISLGDANRYQTTINNREYIVEEQKYAIFPQKSGSLTISSPVFSALVYDATPQRVNAQDKAVTLKVRPIPQNIAGDKWLPSKQVRLSEKYEQTSQTISQGSTLLRTINIEAAAIPAQLIPALHFADSKEFSVYTEKGKEQNQVIQNELTGKVTIKVTYLFKDAGKIIIPETKLAWFNTTTGKPEVAVLPPRSIEITPSAVQPVNNAVQASAQATNQAPLAITQSTTSLWPWLIALVFGLAWLITLFLWYWQRRAKVSVSGAYKKSLQEFNKSCAECNPQKARDSLLKWASLHFPDASILNLSDLSQLVRDVHLKKQLNQLSRVLYKNDEKVLWRGDELARSVQQLSRVKSKTHSRKDSLPPINPE